MYWIYKIAYFPILRLSVFNWLGIIALIFFIITAVAGSRGVPIDRHKILAKIAIILAVAHGLIALSRYF